MKLVFCVFVVVFSVSAVRSQDVDSLSKYSYSLFGIHTNSDSGSKVRAASGTCFFIRNKGALYLVTAKHVLTGCGDSLARSAYPGTMFLWLPLDSGKHYLFGLNVSSFRNKSPCGPLSTEPDVIVVPITDSILIRSVASVEGFIKPRSARLRDLRFIGYPGFRNIRNGTFADVTPSTLHVRMGEYDLVRYYADPRNTVPDTLNFYIRVKSTTAAAVVGGYSGSPFFAQDARTKEWKLAGLLSASSIDPGNPEIVAVKVEAVLGMIVNSQ